MAVSVADNTDTTTACREQIMALASNGSAPTASISATALAADCLAPPSLQLQHDKPESKALPGPLEAGIATAAAAETDGLTSAASAAAAIESAADSKADVDLESCELDREGYELVDKPASAFAAMEQMMDGLEMSPEQREMCTRAWEDAGLSLQNLWSEKVVVAFLGQVSSGEETTFAYI